MCKVVASVTSFWWVSPRGAAILSSTVVGSRNSAQTQAPTALTVKHLQPKGFIIHLNKSNPYGHIPKPALPHHAVLSDPLAARWSHFFLAFFPIKVSTSPALLSPRDGAVSVPQRGLYTPSGGEPWPRPAPPGRPVPALRRQEALPTPPPRWWPEARAACPRRGGGAGAEEAGTDVAGRRRRGRGAAGRGRPAPSGGWMAASERGTAALGNSGRGAGGAA